MKTFCCTTPAIQGGQDRLGERPERSGWQDYLDRARFRLASGQGINADNRVLRRQNNWWATYAFWVFRLFGLDDSSSWWGTGRWVDEGGRRRPVPSYPAGNIVGERDDRPFASRGCHMSTSPEGKLVDVRSPESIPENGARAYPQRGDYGAGTFRVPGHPRARAVIPHPFSDGASSSASMSRTGPGPPRTTSSPIADRRRSSHAGCADLPVGPRWWN
jgi:thiosulfate/3-mercaptopyruvate sulfurtransferase